MRYDFYIFDSPAILRHFTKKEWTRKSVEKLPKIKDNDYTIEIWYNKRTTFTHFKRRYFDTLVTSTTVKEGELQGYYIYTVQE